MKRIILIALIICPVWTWAQGFSDRHFDPEEFDERIENMLVKRAKLSEKETKAFLPIHQEYQKKQRKIGKQIFELKDDDYETSQECAAAITKIRTLEVQLATNTQDYTQKLLKVLPARKVFRLMKTEDDFRRSIVMGDRGKPQDNRMGQREPAPRPHNGERDRD